MKTELITVGDGGGRRKGFKIAPRALRRQRQGIERAAAGNLHAHGDGVAHREVRRSGGDVQRKVTNGAVKIRRHIFRRQRQRLDAELFGGEGDLALFALIEELAENLVAALVLRGQHDDHAGGERAEGERAGFHSGERQHHGDDRVNAVADLRAAPLAFDHLADAETLGGRRAELEVTEILHIVTQVKFHPTDDGLAGIDFF